MTDLGKVDRSFFDEHIHPRLGADRDDVALGPTHGVDFGVLDLDGTALVAATDPLSVLPALGFDRAARFALHVVLSDAAVSGLPPSHLAISLALPPEMDDASFATFWEAVDDEASELGVSVLTGHTARYAGCRFPWVGAATAFAVGDPADVIRPDGARPGDAVLVTKGPAVETTGLFAALFPDRLDLPEATRRAAESRLDETALVGDARAAADAGGVTAMHDATEGGVHGALLELAESAGVGLELDRDPVPVRPGVFETCEALGIDPWRATTAGTLLLAVAPDRVEGVVAALESRGTPVGVAGAVVEGEGVRIDGERIEPAPDPSWAAYERLSGDRETPEESRAAGADGSGDREASSDASSSRKSQTSGDREKQSSSGSRTESDDSERRSPSGGRKSRTSGDGDGDA